MHLLGFVCSRISAGRPEQDDENPCLVRRQPVSPKSASGAGEGEGEGEGILYYLTWLRMTRVLSALTIRS